MPLVIAQGDPTSLSRGDKAGKEAFEFRVGNHEMTVSRAQRAREGWMRIAERRRFVFSGGRCEERFF